MVINQYSVSQGALGLQQPGFTLLPCYPSKTGVDLLLISGPVLDSHQCGASDSSCRSEHNEALLTDNHAKVLVEDRGEGHLLLCGSVRQGACYKYQLQDISRQAQSVLQSVAANTDSGSTFGFIGPQHYNPWSPNPQDVLYVGTTFTNLGDYRHDVPAISSRELNNLEYAEWSISKQSLLRIDVKYRDYFLVNYVHG